MTADFTLGAEEEYQLVELGGGELRSRARDVLATDWSREITKEIQGTQLEIGTEVCASAAELSRELRRLRFQAASTAAAWDLSIVAAGLHPFSRWEPHRPMQDERYARLLERFGRVKRNEHVFGMHVHVAVPAELDRVHLSNVIRHYLPHLLALSASSPLFEGADTGYASYRSILTRRLPHTGAPPRFASQAELRRFVELLLRTGAIEDEWTLYWSLRPHPAYPTLEFRAPDACPSVEDATAVAALCRALVAAAAEGRLVEPGAELSGAAVDAVLRTNEWLAARYGLDARLVAPGEASGEAPMRDAVRSVLEVVGPVAESLGDGEQLARIPEILEEGNAAERIRAAWRENASLPALVRWLSRESLVGAGMDRRSAQREGIA